MKNPKKQKAKTYERRKNANKKEQARKESIIQQIRDVEDEINDYKTMLFSGKFELGGKIISGTLMGIVGGICPLAFLSLDSENLNETFNKFVQKVGEEPLFATTPVIGFIAGSAFLNYVLHLDGVMSFSDIKKIFRYNKHLLDKKAELEAKLERINYVDADKARNKGKAKTYKNKRLN